MGMDSMSSAERSVYSPNIGGKMQRDTARMSPLVQTILIIGALSTLSAQQTTPIVIGLPAVSGSGNCVPFGCPNQFGLTEFQQVYPSTSFPGPVTINQITFFNMQDFQGAPVTAATYQFSLSSTSQAVGGLDASNLTNNVGPDNQIFFSGQISGPLAAQKLTI